MMSANASKPRANPFAPLFSFSDLNLSKNFFLGITPDSIKSLTQEDIIYENILIFIILFLFLKNNMTDL